MNTNPTFRLAAIAVILALLTVNVPLVLAFPPLPSGFLGTVKVDGVNVPMGTVVSVWINGVKYAETTVFMHDSDTVYSLDVPGDDSSTPAVIEGGREGDTIIFYIGGQRADQTGIWHTGTNTRLALSFVTADLSLNKGDWPDPVVAGNLLTYTLTVANHGPAAATGVMLTDTLPAGVTYASASVGCYYSMSSGAAVCDIGSLPKDAAATSTVVVTVTLSAARTIVNTAMVAGDQPDLSPTNNLTTTQTLVNHPPVANDQSVTTDEDVPVAVTLTAVDVDGDTMTYRVVTAPTHGSLSGAVPNLVYTPAANYNGSDSFTFRTSDGTAYSSIATVTITVQPVNDAPVAVDDSYGANRNTVLTIIAPGVLANDTDVDNDTLSAVLVSGPTHGGLTFYGDGSFVYTPTTGYVGSDSLTYRTGDGLATSNVAAATITVHWENHAPVAANDAYTVDEDQMLNAAAPGVLGNDADADSDPLTASLVIGPINGTLKLNLNGAFVYTPTANYSSTDSFTYKASDGIATSNVATVTITIHPGGSEFKLYLPIVANVYVSAPDLVVERITAQATLDSANTEATYGAVLETHEIRGRMLQQRLGTCAFDAQQCESTDGRPIPVANGLPSASSHLPPRR